MNSATHVAEFTYRRAVSCLARGSTSSSTNLCNSDSKKGLRFLLTNVTAHDIMNTDNYSDVI